MDLPEIIKDAISGIFGGQQTEAPLTPKLESYQVDKEATRNLAMDKMLEGVTLGDLIEAHKSGEKFLNIEGVALPCSILEKVNNNIESTPLSDVIKSHGAEFTGLLAQIQAKATEKLESYCAVDELGRDLKPEPAPAQQKESAALIGV